MDQDSKTSYARMIETIEGFQALLPAILVQHKRLLSKMNQMENDIISLMEKQTALEQKRPAHELSFLKKWAYRWKQGKPFSKEEMQIPTELIGGQDEQQSTDTNH